jgi:conjugative transfer region lipoprotein (TIGR03751 family)
LALGLLTTALVACTTRTEDLLTHGDATMHDIWTGAVGSSTAPGMVPETLREARLMLRRPLEQNDAANPADLGAYTRTAQNEITQLFRRLPNPDLVMYVFPHLAGSERVPIPGYSTVFPFYRQVQYTFPGERTEDL